MITPSSKIVIFGGLGFIGEHLVKKLKQQGFSHLTLIERQSEQKKTHYAALVQDVEVLEYTEEITSAFSRVLAEAQVIINLAFTKDRQLPPIDTQLIEFCTEKNKEALLVFLGSAKQFDVALTNLNEHSNRQTSHPYGNAKNQREAEYRAYQAAGGRTIIIRASNVYGPSKRFWRKSTFDTMLFKGIKAGKVTFDVPADTFKDFIFVEDFAEAVVGLIQEKKAIGEAFNVGSGQQTTIQQIAQLIQELFPQVEVVIEAKKEALPNSFCFDISKTQEFINWRPRMNFEAGFKQIAASLENEKNLKKEKL